MISLATLRQPIRLDDTDAADRRPPTTDHWPLTTDADADADAADAAHAADLLVEIFDLGWQICLIIQQSTN